MEKVLQPITKFQERVAVTYYTAEPLVEEPTLEEVARVINRLKINKALCSDAIAAEYLKHGRETLLKHFHALIHHIWKEEQMPSS